MNNFEVEAATPFAESLIWDLNRDYYHEAGIEAWSSSVVPHNLTSNSMVGKTYAELILGFLKDLANKGKKKETVYILELGAGHGRLAFHILKHLERLKELLNLDLPPYCYVLSDIVESNLNFFQEHPQFKTYLDQGILEVAHFDAMKSKEIALRHSGVSINPKDLSQPIIAIANYFFDSIPNDLFSIKHNTISTCSIALESKIDPIGMNSATLLDNLIAVYHKKTLTEPFYDEAILNDILNAYKELVFDTHIFFPQKGLACLANLSDLSNKGLMVLSMDKGFHEIHDLERKAEPEIITHGSFSIWVNYHALGAFCKHKGGKVLYPSYATFYLQMGCLLFMKDGETYKETNAAYQRYVNDFGPDDFNGIKKMTYQHIAQLSLKELIALLRLSAYDSSLFEKFLPRLKQVLQQVTFNERRRFAQTMNQTWDMYFSINEPFDLAYELGGISYDLGFYKDALNYFQHSIGLFGEKADTYYNKALCHFQLREDELFYKVLKEGKLAYPAFPGFVHLDSLEMGSV